MMEQDIALPHEVTIDAVKEYIPGFVEEHACDNNRLLIRYHQIPPAYEVLHLPSLASHHEICIPLGSAGWVERQTEGTWEHGQWSEGTLIFNPAGVQQSWRHARHEALLLYLDVNVLCQAAAVDADPARVELIERFLERDPLVEHLGRTLYRELSSYDVGSRLYTETAAQMLAVHLLRYHCTVEYRVKNYTGGLPPYRLQRVLDYIDAHLDQDLSLEELAQVVDLSPYHFARQFKQVLGQSPYEYVIQQRMSRARRLLRETNLPIAEVAFQVGYTSQSHFTRLFRRLVGATPHAYRQMQR